MTEISFPPRLLAGLCLAFLAMLLISVSLAALLVKIRRKQKAGQAELPIDEEDPAALRERVARMQPIVLQIAMDGIDELRQELRESERVELRAGIEHLLEEWAATHQGMLAKLDDHRFFLIVHRPALQQMADAKFPILDLVRNYRYKDKRVEVTISIGVGQGNSFGECEHNSRQALDMALGRGGDQAAVKQLDQSYEFFGGVSKRVEKTEKVKIRIMAAAFAELMRGCEQVYVMGHRYSDFDSLGAAVGVCAMAQSQGKFARVILNADESMAKPMLERLRAEGMDGMIVTCRRALAEMSDKTLIVVVDAHVRQTLECPELLDGAKLLAVIDHHRQAVDYIQNAVVFYHDPGVSSACEMVTELLHYTMPRPKLSRVQAEAMLAGILLDTRGFLLRTGASTFEAAAFLRAKGADPVEVKRMFAGGQQDYIRRTEIVTNAKLFHRCAVSIVKAGCEDRLLCAQAADELLNLQDVDASFVLFQEDGRVCVSARSLGARNVQLIMERLGGGGHQTMAAAQLDASKHSMEDVVRLLLEAIENNA
ncbi:MAG: DHH family phosphoesterase [Oscillospiraceae bacterium]|nr:DHH family phosphoesterase [Oscillospiraceae bacterium]